MKVLKYYGPDDFRIESQPIPEIGPGELLVRVRASGVCSGETMDWYMAKKAPLVPGHEPAGEVVEVGPGVTSFAIGDRVFAHHHVPCLTCRACRMGHYVQCSLWTERQIEPGAMAEYIRVKARAVAVDTLRLPEGVSYEDGTLIEPLACTVKALKQVPIHLETRVLVIGLGFMGMLNALVARHHGARLVAGLDLVEWRLQKAQALGIHPVLNPLQEDLKAWALEVTDGDLFDVVIVGPGKAEVIRQATQLAARGGSVLVFTPTPPQEVTSLDFNDLYFREVRILPSYSSGPYDTREALALVERGVIRAQDLVTHRFTLDDAARAYQVVKEAQESLKVVVLP